MSHSSLHATACPRCTASLTVIRLAETGLVLRSCSRCDSRWWTKGDEQAGREAVLDAIGARR